MYKCMYVCMSLNTGSAVHSRAQRRGGENGNVYSVAQLHKVKYLWERQDN